MDWVWTDTTLSLSNWMCVEDIYANIFIIKCSREMEKVPEQRERMGTWEFTACMHSCSERELSRTPVDSGLGQWVWVAGLLAVGYQDCFVV